MSSNRKPISAKTRFQVLQRDGYACQTCGARAPNATLHVDHIHAVANGGGNELGNLRTLCVTCNLGKSDGPVGWNVVPIRLPDSGPVCRRGFQLEDLQDVPMRGEELTQPVLWLGLQWAVTPYGIECRDGTYVIEADRLWENEGTDFWEWDRHVGSKIWCDASDFADAFQWAKEHFKHLRSAKKGAR